jgi:serine/threonine protein kinase
VKADDIILVAKVDEGEFGEIFRGLLHGQVVAFKLVKLKTKTGKKIDVMQEFEDEVRIMRHLRHPNIVEFLGVCLNKPKMCIITEYCPLGNLEAWVLANFVKQKKSVPIDLALDLCIDIAFGLNWMHHKGYVHRDIKPTNLLLDQHMRVKIADFGMAYFLDQSKDLSGLAGTEWYMAPEVLQDERYGPKCDVYSFGVVLCELLHGEHPFYFYSKLPQTSSGFAKAINKGLRPEIPARCPKLLKEYVQDCWKREPSARPSMQWLLETLLKYREAYVVDVVYVCVDGGADKDGEQQSLGDTDPMEGKRTAGEKLRIAQEETQMARRELAAVKKEHEEAQGKLLASKTLTNKLKKQVTELDKLKAEVAKYKQRRRSSEGAVGANRQPRNSLPDVTASPATLAASLSAAALLPTSPTLSSSTSASSSSSSSSSSSALASSALSPQTQSQEVEKYLKSPIIHSSRSISENRQGNPHTLNHEERVPPLPAGVCACVFICVCVCEGESVCDPTVSTEMLILLALLRLLTSPIILTRLAHVRKGQWHQPYLESL